MPPPQATEQLYRTVQQFELMLVGIGRRLWRSMLPGDFDGSWARIAPTLVAYTAGAQLAAARAGVEYVPTVLAETGLPDKPLAAIRPQAFSGMASDGRSLPGLLDGAVVRSKEATRSRVVFDDDGLRTVVRGMDGGDALALGQKWLEQAMQTAVADAARDAVAASIITRPSIGWCRMVNPPCCSRCAVLAGRFYAWNEPLLRHPQCDCLNQPTTREEADQYFMDTRKLYEGGFITDLSGKQRARLDTGADMSKVLNESRDRWRERMAADRRASGAVDRIGRSRPTGWNGGGTQPPPVGTTVHDLMARLTDRVQAVDAMRSAGIAT